MTTQYHVYANNCDFGVFDARDEQEAKNMAACLAGYRSEADMERQIEAPSELTAEEIK